MVLNLEILSIKCLLHIVCNLKIKCKYFERKIDIENVVYDYIFYIK